MREHEGSASTAQAERDKTPRHTRMPHPLLALQATAGNPAGAPPSADEQRTRYLRETDPGRLADEDIGPAIELADREHNGARVEQLAQQLDKRGNDTNDFDVGFPVGPPAGAPGRVHVTPEVAIEMLKNMIAGRPAFRPDLGVGGTSWFVTEGDPYVGSDTASRVPFDVDLIDAEGGLIFEQADLDKIFDEEAAKARPEVEAQVRERFRIKNGYEAGPTLSRSLKQKLAFQLRGLAEKRMWARVGQAVAASKAKVGQVLLPPGGRFSKTPGRFTMVADATRIRVRGGAAALLRAIEKSGLSGPVPPPLKESTEELARKMRLAGQVRTVFRVGGKILIVIALAVDTYEIIMADDHLEATLVSLTGWGAAAAAAAGFSAMWLPADVAGPWAWAGHGIGMLATGAVGYWIGANTTRYVYRLAVTSRGTIHEGER